MSQTWFVSRHPGAVTWAEREGIVIDHWVSHLQLNQLRSGDTVIGTLPIHLVARLSAAGVRYRHLSIEIPAEWRGRELSADELAQCGARLETYQSFHYERPFPVSKQD
jgi:CRISPR-associated protein Csx16